MEKYEQIERALITTYRSRLWSKFIKAIKEYDLLQAGDKVCVCISGGKDSMLLAKLFQQLHRYSDFDFDVEYLVMNPGYNEKNLQRIKDNLQYLNIPAKIVDTNIFDVANNMSKNPCYICAKMRRGALYRIAQEMGCNKIALGHHYDDVIETILMNMLNAGSFQTMLPKLHSDNFENMQLIRPMYLIRERDIITWQNSSDLHFIQCACKLTESLVLEDGTSSQRYQTKLLIKDLEKYNVNVDKNIFASVQNVNLDKIFGYKKGGKQYTYLDDYDN